MKLNSPVEFKGMGKRFDLIFENGNIEIRPSKGRLLLGGRHHIHPKHGKYLLYFQSARVDKDHVDNFTINKRTPVAKGETGVFYFTVAGALIRKYNTAGGFSYDE